MASDGSTMTSDGESKVFRDPIHGHIKLHPLLVAIVDTSQFQRLRNIKQLGIKHHVYPGATHTRFEHSLGVAHLAGEYLKMIEQNTGEEKWKELGVTPEDMLCVQIAGLCHDLGHGPFSHLFDDFAKDILKVENWKHENASLLMFEHLLEANPLVQEKFEYYLPKKDGTDYYKGLIKDLIHPEGPQRQPTDIYPKKTFLFEIVSNKETEIDVDKWDYLQRDAINMGIPCNFEPRRTIQLARVIMVEEDGNNTHICIRDKEAYNLYQMFHTRYTLYRRALFHPVCVGAEMMVKDILSEAKDYLKFPSSSGHGLPTCTLSEAVRREDMVAYTMMTDQVFQQIRVSTDGELQKSQGILQRLETRDLYESVAEAVPKHIPCTCTCTECRCQQWSEPEKPKLEVIIPDVSVRENFEIFLAKYKYYGSAESNPLQKVWYYSKKEPLKAFHIKPEQVSAMLPVRVIKEKELRLYCKSLDKDIREEGIRCFKTWCGANEMWKLRDKPTGEVAADVEARP